MNKDIFRNVAIVTAIFMVTLSTMLITNYFQVRGTTPLQTEVVETLKQLNDTNPDNPELQEQIRQLDLLARRAYFIQSDHLKTGVYILLGMVAVFVVCLRFYFAGAMEIPDKEIDPVDEWMIKSRSRKYITWGTAGLVAVSLLFVFLSSPYLNRPGDKQQEAGQALLAENGQVPDEAAGSGEAVAEEAGVAENVPPSGEVATAEPAVEESLPPAGDVVAEQEADPVVDSTADVRIPVGETPQVAAGKVPAEGSGATHNGFRGNRLDGISTAQGVPVEWNLAAGTNIAWKKEVPRAGFNSPIINGNRVFFTGADEQARELYCYDLATGEQRWSLAATDIPGSPSVMPKVTDDAGLASSTAVTDGKRVCAIFATGDILCADMDGKRLWAKNLGVPDNHYAFVSSLLIFGNTLFVQYDNNEAPRLIALDVATGNQRWVKNRPGKTCWSSPAIAYVDKKPQLVLMGNPAITAYDPATGDQLWQVECMGGEVCVCPSASGGVIFGANEYAKLVAIDGADGKVLWESTEYLPEVSSPVATKDHLYVATSYGVLASYDIRTGALAGEHELNVEFYSSPMVVDGKLYLFSNDGKMHIFSTDEEFQLLSSFDTGERTLATPAFTDGRIVIRSEKSIYCVAAN